MKSQLKSLVEIIESGNYVILDTETTGHDEMSEIAQIAVIEPDGYVLVDKIIRPCVAKVDQDGMLRTKYNQYDVKNAYNWHIYSDRISIAIGARTVVTYDAASNRRMLIQSSAHDPIRPTNWYGHKFSCAMVAYAEHVGEWDHWSQSYKWKPLWHAALAAGVKAQAAHTALGDCITTLAVCQWLVSVAKFDKDPENA